MATASSQCQRGAPHRNGLSSSRVNSSAELRLVPRAAQLMCWMLLVMVSLLADRLQQHRTPSRVPEEGLEPGPIPIRRPRSGGECHVTCDSCSPWVTAGARREPAVPDAVRTQRGPGSRAWKARPVPWSWPDPAPLPQARVSVDRPLLTVSDRQMPMLRARGGHGRRGPAALQRDGDGHKLNRRVRPVHDDHLPRWQAPYYRCAADLSAVGPLLHGHGEAIAAQLGAIAADRPKDRFEGDTRQERRATMDLEVVRSGAAWRGRQVTQRQPARRLRADPIRIEINRAGHRKGGIWRGTVDVDRHLDGEGSLVLGGGGD